MTGHTLFYLMYSREAILLVEERFFTWRTLDWEGVKTRAELITIRVRHFEMRAEDVDEAIARKIRKR